jgi:hypothetical protein
MKNRPEYADSPVGVSFVQLGFMSACAGAERSDIIAYSREHLSFVPFEEHPARPIADPSKIQR